MSGGFQVTPEQLSTHAATVSGIASGVHEAAAAAGIERGGGLVYGVLFDLLALPPLNLWADHIQDLIETNATTGEAIAKALRSNAEVYETAEATNTTHISKSGPR